MRAAIIERQGAAPLCQEFDQPSAQAGESLINVSAGAIGPTDLMRAAGLFGPMDYPYVVGGEGTGHLEDGSRVYFGHARKPFGAWAEKTVVPNAEVWAIPDQVSDEHAIALGISGTGAYIPLQEAQIKAGETVLILGATGPLGQIALQLAKRMGAGTVVAAARGIDALNQAKQRGLADKIVQLGDNNGDDHLSALKAAAPKGYDVVLDCIFGAPAEAALKATAAGGRMMSIGVGAGNSMTITLGDLVFRQHHGVGTGQRPAAERKAVFNQLMAMAVEEPFTIDCLTFALEQAAEAWAAQGQSPHGKIIVRP